MINFLKKWRVIIIFILFILFSFIIGVSYGKNYYLNEKEKEVKLNIINDVMPSSTEVVDMAPFWKVWSLLDEKFVITKNNNSTTTAESRVWGAIQGMTESLGDPYTVFLPPDDSKEFEADISGNFEGVGMEIGIKDDTLSVISPLKGSPAERAGIKTGDKIITIDGKPAIDLSTDKAVKLIRGPQGTTVKITVLRNGTAKPINFEITREVIDVPTAETQIKDDVFIINLYNFYAQADVKFNNALKDFVKSGKHKLIIDLRGNPGGYLHSAVDMASWFLPLGKPVVREDFVNGKPENVYRSKGYDIFTDKLRLIILVDGGSASASEILAGALQEYGIAELVGTKTYGKGSVQELVSVTKDTSLKVTIAKWLTPNGKSISEGGLTPDYEVKISEADFKAGKDTQLEKALELLK